MGTHSVSTVLGVGTTLVGRDSELAALSGWLDEALTGSPRLVLLGGEPGIGKTRLADELSSIAPSAGVTVVWGRGTEEEGAPPFWPWRQVLARLGRDDVLDSGSHAEPEVERFARFVPGHRRALLGCRNGRPAGRARRRPSDRRPLGPAARARGRFGHSSCAAARHSPLESVDDRSAWHRRSRSSNASATPSPRPRWSPTQRRRRAARTRAGRPAGGPGGRAGRRQPPARRRAGTAPPGRARRVVGPAVRA